MAINMEKPESVTLQKVYKKLEDIDNKLTIVEKILVPEVKLNSKELRDLEKRRKEIRSGHYLNEKELFKLLKE